MKTIFITSFNPFIGRNILFSPVLTTLLKKRDIRVVVFVYDYKAAYFKSVLPKTIIVHGLPPGAVTREDVFFRNVGQAIVDTSTLRFHSRRLYAENKNGIRYFGAKLLREIFGHGDFIKRMVRAIDEKLIVRSGERFAEFFARYRPDMLFATDMFHNDDTHFLAEAKKRGVRTIGMIRSWDNITTKGLFRIKPDRLIVHNHVIAAEAREYEAMREEELFVSGLPQFDYYAEGTAMPKQTFLKARKLKPRKKIILFAPHGKRFHDTDGQILEILKQARNDGRLPRTLQYIVRFPPNDTVDISAWKEDVDFSIERTGKSFKPGAYNDQEVTMEDTQTLHDELAYAAMVLHYGSTLAIDASSFDRPNIFISFDGFEKPSYWRSVRKFREYAHVEKLLRTGACKIADTAEELIAHINFYLKHPDADKKERARLVKEQCVWTDGKSGERLGEFLLRML